MGRRILEAKIKFITLCPRGANRMPVIYKDDGHFDIDMIIKAEDSFMEKGELLAVVYAPESRDVQGDIASADVIKKMMYDAAKEGVNVDIRHNEIALKKEQAFVAEQFIIQKNDPRFTDFKNYSGEAVDVTGGWATVIKIDDPELRKLYKENKWNGVSMMGHAKVQTEKSDDIVDQVVARLAQSFNGGHLKEKDMDKTEVASMIKEATPGIVAATAEAVVKAMKAESDAAVKKADEEKAKLVTSAPIFKGDPSNLAEVKKHREAVAAFNLAKSVDWTDAESIAKYEEELAKQTTASGEEDAEVAKLEKELAAAKKRSNLPPATKGTKIEKGEENSDLSKEDNECIEIGRKMATAMNKR